MYLTDSVDFVLKFTALERGEGWEGGGELCVTKTLSHWGGGGGQDLHASKHFCEAL
jgi:hypothetical protein